MLGRGGGSFWNVCQPTVSYCSDFVSFRKTKPKKRLWDRGAGRRGTTVPVSIVGQGTMLHRGFVCSSGQHAAHVGTKLGLVEKEEASMKTLRAFLPSRLPFFPLSYCVLRNPLDFNVLFLDDA